MFKKVILSLALVTVLLAIACAGHTPEQEAAVDAAIEAAKRGDITEDEAKATTTIIAQWTPAPTKTPAATETPAPTACFCEGATTEEDPNPHSVPDGTVLIGRAEFDGHTYQYTCRCSQTTFRSTGGWDKGGIVTPGSCLHPDFEQFVVEDSIMATPQKEYLLCEDGEWIPIIPAIEEASVTSTPPPPGVRRASCYQRSQVALRE